MDVTPTRIDGVLIVDPRRFKDNRGYFYETWAANRYADFGIPGPFVQDNASYSNRGVLRGLHFQNPNPQGKLVSALQGSVFDVVVDLRRSSATFGEWVGVDLTSDNGRQLWVPAGLAHGFVVTSDSAVVHYKCTSYYDPKSEHTLVWNDPDVGIQWPNAAPVLSEKDAQGKTLRELESVMFRAE